MGGGAEVSLVNKLREGCVQVPKRWSGDCGEFSTVDEVKTDELMREAAEKIEVLTYALERIRDIEWLQYSNRIDAIQQLAKHALQ